MILNCDRMKNKLKKRDENFKIKLLARKIEEIDKIFKKEISLEEKMKKIEKVKEKYNRLMDLLN
jgi:hypothetical protein